MRRVGRRSLSTPATTILRMRGVRWCSLGNLEVRTLESLHNRDARHSVGPFFEQIRTLKLRNSTPSSTRRSRLRLHRNTRRRILRRGRELTERVRLCVTQHCRLCSCCFEQGYVTWASSCMNLVLPEKETLGREVSACQFTREASQSVRPRTRRKPQQKRTQ